MCFGFYGPAIKPTLQHVVDDDNENDSDEQQTAKRFNDARNFVRFANFCFCLPSHVAVGFWVGSVLSLPRAPFWSGYSV